MSRRKLTNKEILDCFDEISDSDSLQSDDDFSSNADSEYQPSDNELCYTSDEDNDQAFAAAANPIVGNGIAVEFVEGNRVEVIEDDVVELVIEANVVDPNILDRSFVEPVIWGKPSELFVPKHTIPVHSKLEVQVTPNVNQSEFECFKLMFPKGLFIFIAECTNERLIIYNREKNVNERMTDEGEIMMLLGIVFVMCYNHLPSQSDYWSTNESLGNPFIKKYMSRNRFQLLISKMYFNHPEKPDDAGKLYYAEELLNCFKYTFQKWVKEGNYQSIDESMTKFKGRSSLKQYMPLKPIKRGIKVWQRCDSFNGYIYDLNIYAGKEVSNDPQNTLGERVVIKLSESLQSHNVLIAFDRFFTSIKLLTQLPCAAVGTCMRNRKNIPVFGNKLAKGESEFKVNADGFVAARWMDSKEVIMISNCHRPDTEIVKRKQKDGQKIDVTCPTSIATYNKIMGGVDLADQKVQIYDFDRKSTKWWKKFFFKSLMAAAVNGHIIHQDVVGKKTSLLNFLVNLAEQLVLTGRQTAKVTRKIGGKSGPRSKKAKLLLNIGDHLPVPGSGRRRCTKCALEKKDKRTKFVCSSCDIPLCNECFTPYHS